MRAPPTGPSDSCLVQVSYILTLGIRLTSVCLDEVCLIGLLCSLTGSLYVEVGSRTAYISSTIPYVRSQSRASPGFQRAEGSYFPWSLPEVYTLGCILCFSSSFLVLQNFVIQKFLELSYLLMVPVPYHFCLRPWFRSLLYSLTFISVGY